MRRIVLSLLLLVALIVTACGAPTPMATTVPGVASEADVSSDTLGIGGTISAAGSTTVQPLAEKLAEAFIAMNPGLRIDVQGGGSSVGVKSAGQSTVDIGMVSREVKQSELDEFPNIKVYVIALDGIAIVAHPDIPADNLTMEQVQKIFAGQITNWKDVGGPDHGIFVAAREEGSGTRGAFDEMVMGKDLLVTDLAILQQSNGMIRTTVATTPYCISFLSFGYLDSSVKTIAVDGVQPTEENAASGKYPVVRPLNLLTSGEPEGAVKAWLDYILGPEGQELVSSEGYIKVK